MRKKQQQKSLTPLEFLAMTPNQRRFQELFENKHIVAMGYPGTGKTYVALHLAAQAVLELEEFEKIVIFRSAVPSRDMGFLPGDENDKLGVYGTPYVQNINRAFGRDDAFQILTSKKFLSFQSTSFNRGITLDDAVIVVDEFQNMTFQELDTIITRVGENSKIVFSGDLKQSDLPKNQQINSFIDILRTMRDFAFIEFGIDDIVRSGLVKNYIIAKDKHDNR